MFHVPSFSLAGKSDQEKAKIEEILLRSRAEAYSVSISDIVVHRQAKEEEQTKPLVKHTLETGKEVFVAAEKTEKIREKIVAVIKQSHELFEKSKELEAPLQLNSTEKMNLIELPAPYLPRNKEIQREKIEKILKDSHAKANETNLENIQFVKYYEFVDENAPICNPLNMNRPAYYLPGKTLAQRLNIERVVEASYNQALNDAVLA